MAKESKKNLQMDPRTKIMLIFIANIVAFANSSVYMETLIIVAISVLLLLCGCIKSSIKWIAFYGALLFIQYYLIPVMPTFLAVMFSVLAIYARKLLPCMMIGELIIKTIPVRLIILSLQKWKIPQKIIIPLSITIRYFPAIKEEVTHIKEAIKMRKIKGVIRRIECMYVPMLISAANIAEELSAAAITRGIENPAPKTSVVDIRFYIQDYICLAIGIIFIVIIMMQ